MIDNQNPLQTSPPINQTPEQSEALHKRHFRSFWPIMAIAVLSAIVGGLLVWALFNQGLEEEINSLIPGKMVIHKNSDSFPKGGSDLKDWQTYTNEKLLYELKYPKDYFVLKDEKIVFSAGSSQSCKTASELKSGSIWPQDCVIIYVATHQKPLFTGGEGLKKSKVWVDGAEAEKVEDTNFGMAEDLLSAYVQVNKNNQWYEITVRYSVKNQTPALELFDQVISGFKFIEPKITIDTSTWQTYKNVEYGFEIRYPNIYENHSSDGLVIQTKLGEITARVTKNKILNSQVKHGDFGLLENPKEVILAGLAAYQFKLSKNCQGYLTLLPYSINDTEASIEISLDDCYAAGYHGSLDGTLSLYNQILSTFKFVELAGSNNEDLNKKEKLPFQSSKEYGYFGTLTLTGYLDVQKIICNPGDMCAKTVDYAFFIFNDTTSQLVYEMGGEYAGNTFMGKNSIGLGCYEKEKDRIYSNNFGDSGEVESIISGTALNKLLKSGLNNQVRLKLAKPVYTSGQGAPECYSHFRNFEVFE